MHLQNFLQLRDRVNGVMYHNAAQKKYFYHQFQPTTNTLWSNYLKCDFYLFLIIIDFYLFTPKLKHLSKTQKTYKKLMFLIKMDDVTEI